MSLFPIQQFISSFCLVGRYKWSSFDISIVILSHVTNATVWDVGGQDKIRPLWRHYYQNTQGLIFVVDSNDRDRVDAARDELHRMLNEDELRESILLVFANKQVGSSILWSKSDANPGRVSWARMCCIFIDLCMRLDRTLLKCHLLLNLERRSFKDFSIRGCQKLRNPCNQRETKVMIPVGRTWH